MLTDREIILQRHRGNIVIEPWDDARLNPNSYNLSLAPELYYYSYDRELDLRRHDDPVGPVMMTDAGYLLQPGNLYLCKTLEWTETRNHVPVIDGRSSVGRKGIFIHVTAGFGDIGFCGQWTLEIVCVIPVRIYPFVQICQIRYERPDGPVGRTYQGKYQGARDVIPSLLSEEFRT